MQNAATYTKNSWYNLNGIPDRLEDRGIEREDINRALNLIEMSMLPDGHKRKFLGLCVLGLANLEDFERTSGC